MSEGAGCRPSLWKQEPQRIGAIRERGHES